MPSRRHSRKKHYDRYSYMAEKREAMDIWDSFVRVMLDQRRKRRIKIVA